MTHIDMWLYHVYIMVILCKLIFFFKVYFSQFLEFLELKKINIDIVIIQDTRAKISAVYKCTCI